MIPLGGMSVQPSLFSESTFYAEKQVNFKPFKMDQLKKRFKNQCISLCSP